jgi:hypothetical protein
LEALCGKWGSFQEEMQWKCCIPNHYNPNWLTGRQKKNQQPPKLLIKLFYFSRVKTNFWEKICVCVDGPAFITDTSCNTVTRLRLDLSNWSNRVGVSHSVTWGRKHPVPETLCSLEYRTMAKVQEPGKSERCSCTHP